MAAAPRSRYRRPVPTPGTVRPCGVPSPGPSAGGTTVDLTNEDRGKTAVVENERIGVVADVAGGTAYVDPDWGDVNVGLHAVLDWGRDDGIVDWARTPFEAMSPSATGGAYANYRDRDECDRVAAAFEENGERLAAVKNE